jgi:hypothetical protein
MLCFKNIPVEIFGEDIGIFTLKMHTENYTEKSNHSTGFEKIVISFKEN